MIMMMTKSKHDVSFVNLFLKSFNKNHDIIKALRIAFFLRKCLKLYNKKYKIWQI